MREVISVQGNRSGNTDQNKVTVKKSLVVTKDHTRFSVLIINKQG